MRIIAALLIGLIFGTGISISGMGNPAKVINFFDFAGTWDASLILVMGSALVVTMIGYRFVLARPAPVMGDRFALPTKSTIDSKLVLGSIVFGVGWGMTGFCPGGAIPVLGTGRIEVVMFIVSMIVGIGGAVLVQRQMAARTAATASAQ